ncbi:MULTISPECIES: hypothetical protein [Pseudomonas syringae group]|uniref:Uncharacterized protein n=1 Tax=Pseudomonas lijiangensis TaxID=2995658 RepID=A0ABX8HPG7_9PSED|nr:MULTISPECIES: hypothetical protein [Pseudomonas syringae group]MBX8484499.1 hypothetical protein [Pseudomonas cichorii]MBX8500702.1 hypothetical protein [Pseudomonas lijiangensis]MBX8504504.1 hypothetical protein [Pseudomonas lijiangensis]MBX8521819.1 hypothetical protein [Pseudomonas cichorii]MBX8592388.1 hypothetical protein [Pseudomonas cichorii]
MFHLDISIEESRSITLFFLINAAQTMKSPGLKLPFQAVGTGQALMQLALGGQTNDLSTDILPDQW